MNRPNRKYYSFLTSSTFVPHRHFGLSKRTTIVSASKSVNQYQFSHYTGFVHKMKTLGLLGGMTFESTSLYYDLINRHARAELGSRSSAPLYLFSVNQEEMIQYAIAGRWDQFANVYCKAAKTLESGGVDGMVICASLAHKVADDIERHIKVPLLHIADFVAKEMVEKGIKRVALLGTRVVMEDDFIKGRIEQKFGIEVLVPDSEDRIAVNRGIVEELTTGKVSDSTKAMFIRLAKDLIKKGAQGLILGSTDLGFVLKEDDLNIPLLDTAKIHALGVARWAIQQDQ